MSGYVAVEVAKYATSLTGSSTHIVASKKDSFKYKLSISCCSGCGCIGKTAEKTSELFHGDKVFQLVTESNYRNFLDVVWETIANFGTSTYFDEAFRPVDIDLEEAQLVVEDIPIGFTSTTITIPDGTSTNKLKDEIFKKIENASQTTLEFHGNSLTITGTHHNVEHTKLIVEVIAHNLDPVVPDRTLKFAQDKGNEILFSQYPECKKNYKNHEINYDMRKIATKMLLKRKESGETISLPLPVELCQSVVFEIPYNIRASIALRCDFTKFMKYINKVNNTFSFRDVTSINGIQMTGYTATETRNHFQAAVIHESPKVGHISVVLQRISVVNDEYVESNMTNETSISPSETLRESPLSSSATTSVCVQPGQNVEEKEGPPRSKARKMTESVKGNVVYWKGHDRNVTVLSMLNHASRFGRITNILLHKSTTEAMSSFMEFEMAEAAKLY
ncbi:hypothetical protein DAPPUDRAFT_335520 [Daphnia pulex]|uniref:Uncharacterized protein n=1 Tax=Daphnia pulex TaxID=6669 RepID=E9HXY6_DAPPU|nr:hypothetical protein DAPPUDRAFT_335520 [Daphnia pulex]|eukprot:EFX63392.1 hypothetical protein DAPPUDRAFT_335520 [Daphnia pulex]